VLLTLRIWILRAGSWLFSAMPHRGTIVLASARSRTLSGNLAYVHAELVRRGLDSRVKLLLSKPRSGLLGKLASLWSGIVAEYHLATCDVFIVDDYYFPIYVARLGPKTTVIQTWHASGAFKKVGYSVVGKRFGASEELVKRVHIHSGYTHCLVASQSALPHYAEAFGQPAERFVSIGIPRTDLFFDDGLEVELADEIRVRYAIPEGRTVVVYAPTFRGESMSEAHYDDYLDLRTMHERLGESHVVLMRLHPAVADTLELDDSLAGFVVDVSGHPEINELLLVSDVLVTDYSSAIFDYALLERPMAFLAPDLEDYEEERGFYFDYRSGVPGPVFETTEELADALSAGAWDLDAVRAFRDRAFDIADGRASERFVDELVLPHV
jgi:CDP-ribitol ribitolphosphotransferase